MQNLSPLGLSRPGIKPQLGDLEKGALLQQTSGDFRNYKIVWTSSSEEGFMPLQLTCIGRMSHMRMKAGPNQTSLFMLSCWWFNLRINQVPELLLILSFFHVLEKCKLILHIKDSSCTQPVFDIIYMKSIFRVSLNKVICSVCKISNLWMWAAGWAHKAGDLNGL
jgi:hypothetical protein